jgi:multiple sugar transport system permease protein
MYNSTVIAIIATSLSVLITLPAAYSIVRYFNGLGSFTLGFSLLLRMMPAMCMAIPVFIIFSRLKLVDTLTAIIMMHTLFIAPTALLLFIGYIQNFPREIEEAAQIDGANVIQTIGYVLFPIIRPGVAAVAILGFITSWNEFLFSMVLSFRNAITVTVATDYFVTNYAIRWGEMAAGIAVSTIPTLIFMFLAQRQIIEGMTAGAVKG